MCIKNYDKVLMFMQNTDEVVSPKIMNFISSMPKALVEKINNNEQCAFSKEGANNWYFQNSEEGLKISYRNSNVNYETDYVGRIELILNANNEDLINIKSNEPIAIFNYEIFKGEKCVKSIDADFVVEKNKDQSFNCKYDIKFYNSIQNKIASTKVESIEL